MKSRLCATVKLPSAICPGCGEENFVQNGVVVEHGDARGMCIEGVRIEFAE